MASVHSPVLVPNLDEVTDLSTVLVPEAHEVEDPSHGSELNADIAIVSHSPVMISSLTDPSSDSPSNESQAPSLSPVVVSTLDDMTELQRMELLQCDLFAMDCEGVDLGRSGTICLVQLSTPSACYLFDVLGQDSTSDLMVFLRIILQDRKKTKVIHDCKMDADALFHLCGIQLVGVHDTQSWDVALRGGVATNLNNTLQAYGCKINTQRDHNLYRGNPSFWATRPLTVHMIEWASGDVRHLFDLHRAQMNMVTMAGPEVRAWCVAQSEENADKLRDLVMVTSYIAPSKIGLFIGRGGSNLANLRARVPGSYFHTRTNDESAVKVDVYAVDGDKLDRALGLLRKYQVDTW